MLRWAREAINIPVDELAAYLKKSPDEIEDWEDGTASPTYRQLQKFAKKVGRAVATLYLPKPPDEPAPPTDFRVLPGEDRGSFTREAHLAFRELRNNMGTLKTVLSDLGAFSQLKLPEWNDLGSCNERAAQFRALIGIDFEEQMSWKDPRHALNEWRDRLFDLGVLAQIFVDVPMTDVRAFSLLHDGLGGIGLNSKDASAGRVFSLFHEVAHLCLRSPGVSGDVPEAPAESEDIDALERYCDRFAAAFLLPHEHPQVRDALVALQDDFRRPIAEQYASRFKVSKYVVARRLQDEGRVSSDAYWSAREQWQIEDAKRPARRTSEGGPDPVVSAVSHAGKRFVGAVLDARDVGLITTYEASSILSLNKPAYLDRAYEMVAS